MCLNMLFIAFLNINNDLRFCLFYVWFSYLLSVLALLFSFPLT